MMILTLKKGGYREIMSQGFMFIRASICLSHTHTNTCTHPCLSEDFHRPARDSPNPEPQMESKFKS